MYFLSKLLPLFVLPLGVSLILVALGLARQRRRLAWAGVAVLFVCSNPLVGHFLMRSTEGWTERRTAADVAPGDAIVVLSAGRSLPPGPGKVSDWHDANRFFGGIELALAGKAPLLVFTGASFSSEPGVLTEGELLATEARARGVAPDRIVVTPLVLNTDDEAREVAAVLRTRQMQTPRVLLVTSAFHMRRARMLFEQRGITVDPFPVSFGSSDQKTITLFSFLPSVSALTKSQTALRELYGRAFYWLRAVAAQ